MEEKVLNLDHLAKTNAFWDNVVEHEFTACTHCGGTGSTKEDPNYCKKCNTYAKDVVPNIDFTQEFVSFYIPARSRKKWDYPAIKEIVNNQKVTAKAKSSLLLKLYDMSDIIENFKEKHEGKLTYYFHMPRYTDIETYIYNLLVSYMHYNYTVASVTFLPDIDIKDKDLLRVEVLPIKLISMLSDEDLTKLEYILAYRYGKNLITILNSPINLQELNKKYGVDESIIIADFTADFVQQL